MKEINRHLPVALYYQLKTIIRDQVEKGMLKPGEMIPSENEFMKRYGVSRTTVRQAIGDLVAEGILERIQGKGTFVASQKLQQNLFALTSFSEDIRNLGRTPSSLEIEKGYVRPALPVADFFELASSESLVFFLSRVRLVDDEPVGMHTVYLPEDIAEQADLMERDFSTGLSLYHTLEESGVTFGEAEETLEAGSAPPEASARLNIAEGAPVLLLDRLSYTPSGRPLEYNHMVYRSDRYKYRIRLPRLRR